jgi:SAM-dependent methyltransferase
MISDVSLTSPAREARPGILSVLPPNDEGAHYDARAAAYDRVVGSPLYNRLLWSTSASGYHAFARAALASGTGPVLEAGCGSAVFTARAYVESDRPAVLVDRSIGMLEAARDRLAAAGGGTHPPHVTLLQADLFDLPFERGAFGSVLSMGMLHLFEDASEVVRPLDRVRAEGGSLHLSGLVAETPVGKRYLALLHRSGEVATPRRFAEVRAGVEAAVREPVAASREGSMAYYTASRR